MSNIDLHHPESIPEILDWRMNGYVRDHILRVAMLMALSGQEVTFFVLRNRDRDIFSTLVFELGAEMGLRVESEGLSRYKVSDRGAIRLGVLTLSGCCFEHTPVVVFFGYDEMEKKNPQALQEATIIAAPDEKGNMPTIIKA